VGALAHYLEADGVPTTQISLIREHTEIIRPPRALWAPFELGRPLGAPEDPMLQRRVLLAALELLEANEGPVLADFPGGTPSAAFEAEKSPEVWACPVSFFPSLGEETDPEGLRSAFRREIMELRPWYDLGIERRGRTTVSDFAPDAASELLAGFASGETLGSPREDLPFAVALRLASQDLRAFYFEAAAARPGSTPPSIAEFNSWFWNETVAGRVLRAVKERCLKAEDEAVRMTGAMLIVPMGR
jgi:hypothetical protein